MATRKGASAPKTTALALWEQQMAEAVTKQAASEKPSTFKAISTRGGVLTVDDSPVPGNEMDVVVLASIHENQYFTVSFNPDKPAIPVCYAFSEVDGPEEGMAPHAEVVDKQADDNGLCAACWANQMGSADVGRGKACKNVRRMAVIPADALDSADALEEAEARMLKVPVMSVRGWAAYVREKLGEELKRPSWGVVTTIKLVPDPKSQFRVVFSFKELVNFDQGLYDAMQKKIKVVADSLTAPYVPMEEEPAPPPRGRRPTQAPARGRPAQAPARGRPAQAPVKPQGRMAEAMQKAAGKQAAANPAKGAPAKRAPKY